MITALGLLRRLLVPRPLASRTSRRTDAYIVRQAGQPREAGRCHRHRTPSYMTLAYRSVGAAHFVGRAVLRSRPGPSSNPGRWWVGKILINIDEFVAGGPGFEPRLPGPEPGVLPLNYPPSEAQGRGNTTPPRQPQLMVANSACSAWARGATAIW